MIALSCNAGNQVAFKQADYRPKSGTPDGSDCRQFAQNEKHNHA
jgi:hypothetical protein